MEMIDIVLATYNGQDFLGEQVSSIQQNSGYHKRVSRLIIVDDGSTDNSKEIIKALARQDSKIEFIENNSGQNGASNNFAFGLSKTSANYIMLCDQDDIWLPHKIERSLQRITSAEEQAGLQTPILVFSDKEIVDQDLNLICNSYFTLKNVTKDWHHKLEQLCQQNVISGCTMLFNRALLECALPIPKRAYMHDWWLALVAAKCGKIEFIDQALIQYRQHDSNTIGANKRSKLNLITRFFYHLTQFEKSIAAVIKQASAFALFEKDNNLLSNKTIKTLASLDKQPRHRRIVFFINKTITRSHFPGRVALLIVLLKMKQKKLG